eukprot:sb/3467975/
MLTLQNVTMCDDPAPVLLDHSTMYFGLVKNSQNVTISCAAKGAPFLESHWEGPSGSFVRSRKIYEEEVESEHRITNFNPTIHSGEWKCTFRNINFPDLVSETRSFYLSSLLTEPNNTLSVDARYNWEVVAWPGATFTISCSVLRGEKVGNSVPVTAMSVSSSEDLVRYDISHQLVFDENTVHQVGCALVLHSDHHTWESEKVVLRKECPPSRRYWNNQGMCVSCPTLYHLMEGKCQINVLHVVMVSLGCLVMIIAFVLGVVNLCFDRTRPEFLLLDD